MDTKLTSPSDPTAENGKKVVKSSGEQGNSAIIASDGAEGIGDYAFFAFTLDHLQLLPVGHSTLTFSSEQYARVFSRLVFFLMKRLFFFYIVDRITNLEMCIPVWS